MDQNTSEKRYANNFDHLPDSGQLGPFFKNLVLFAIGIGIVRYIYHRYLAVPCLEAILKRKLAQEGQKAQKESIENEAKKAADSLWRFLVYTFLTSFNFFTIARTRWKVFANPILCGDQDALSTQREWDELFLYGFTSGLYTHMLLEEFTRRHKKDFVMMCVHHVVTLALLLSSAYCCAYTAGSLILLTHDVSDILLELGKFLAKMKYKRVPILIFPPFLCVWIFTRLFYYPYFILYHGFLAYGDLNPQIPSFIRYPVLTLLFSLVVLHVLWTYFIFRFILNMKNLEDPTSPKLKRKQKKIA